RVERDLGRRAFDDGLRRGAQIRGLLGLGLSAALSLLRLFGTAAVGLGDMADILILVAVVIHVVVRHVPIALHALHVLDRHLGLRRGDDPVVVLGVLQVVLGHDAIPGALRVAGELGVLLGDLLRGAADLHIRPVALVIARERIGAPAIVVVAAAIATAHAPV